MFTRQKCSHNLRYVPALNNKCGSLKISHKINWSWLFCSEFEMRFLCWASNQTKLSVGKCWRVYLDDHYDYDRFSVSDTYVLIFLFFFRTDLSFAYLGVGQYLSSRSGCLLILNPIFADRKIDVNFCPPQLLSCYAQTLLLYCCKFLTLSLKSQDNWIL